LRPLDNASVAKVVSAKSSGHYFGVFSKLRPYVVAVTLTIEHTKTKANHPQTNGICERFHKTILNEFYQVAFRRKIYRSIEELQVDLDEWLAYYNNDRTHQGKMCCGRTPMQTLLDGKEAWRDKITALNS
jgi:transposase InsO family protein